MPSAPRFTTILLTGFGAFPGARSNPTTAIVRRLSASRRFALLDIKVEGRVLPVIFGQIEASASRALAETRPDAIIHLGLAGRRKTLSVETRAVNRISQLRPDAARRFSATPVVCANGPGFRAARWPAARLSAAMRVAGATARPSIDAGDYLCNQLLYLTLGATSVPAGFIHVPKPRCNACYFGDSRPSQASMTRAVEAAILVMAAQTRRARP